MIPELKRVLLIEDNPDDALLIREALAEAGEAPLALEHLDRLSAGLERLAQGGIDLVLLDLSLPDSHGLDTLATVNARAPSVPVVVLTGRDDAELATQALRLGAQDYLVKGQTDSNLLERSLRYAVERHRLLSELDQARQREEQERELRSLGRFSASTSTSVAAQALGNLSLREGQPETFEKLVHRYQEFLDLSLEQQLFKAEYPISDGIRAISEDLGFLKAGPRDAVAIHSTALQARIDSAPAIKARAYLKEGRLLLLELMGYLVGYYRNMSFGIR